MCVFVYKKGHRAVLSFELWVISLMLLSGELWTFGLVGAVGSSCFSFPNRESLEWHWIHGVGSLEGQRSGTQTGVKVAF